MKIKLSNHGYTEKPDADEIKKITWQMKNSECKNVNFKSLRDYIAKGYSVLLAEFKEVGNINEDNIKSLSCIALDIDSKENVITMYEMISKIKRVMNVYPVLSYCTFSDKDCTKFRLIYELEKKVDVETYRMLYLALQWKFKKYLDPATKNANRIWAGTNKGVNINLSAEPLSFEAIVKLINSYKDSIKRKEKRAADELKKKYQNQNMSNNFDNAKYIKPQYKEEVLKLLINHIDLRDFIQSHLGGSYKRNGEALTGACVLHGGDNETALVINKDRYTCFTHCGCGNIITAARKVYNIENFSEVAFKLLDEHNMSIPDDYIKEIRK